MRYIACLSFALAMLAGAEPPALSADEIVQRMQAADQERLQSFPGYVAQRLYTVENRRFEVKATMKVELAVDRAGRKTFRTLEVTGPGAIRKMVFKRMLETEERASAPSEQAANRISSQNYSFTVERSVTDGSGTFYVLEATPKTTNPLLFQGKIWIDATDFAVAKIEGAPAQKPSFWVKKTRFEHTYRKLDGYWLGAVNTSESDIRMFGTSTTRIDYLDYKLIGAAVAGAP